MGQSDLELTFTTHLRGGPDDDDDDMESATDSVVREWDALGRIMPPPSSPAPPGTRGVDVAQIGAIVAMIAPGGLPAALTALWQWIEARRGRAVEITRADGSQLKITQATAAEQRALIADWIADGRRG